MKKLDASLEYLYELDAQPRIFPVKAPKGFTLIAYNESDEVSWFQDEADIKEWMACETKDRVIFFTVPLSEIKQNE